MLSTGVIENVFLFLLIQIKFDMLVCLYIINFNVFADS